MFSYYSYTYKLDKYYSIGVSCGEIIMDEFGNVYIKYYKFRQDE